MKNGTSKRYFCIANTSMPFKKTKALLLCAAIGCPLFVITFLIEGVTRVGYDPFREPVSSLALGNSGWVQVANFILTGTLVLAFAIGLPRALRPNRIGAAWGPVLIGTMAIGLITAGLFNTDPLPGYPPGAHFNPAYHSIHGILHNLSSALVFFGLPSACFVFCRRFLSLGQWGWAVYSIISGLAMIATFVLAGIGFAQVPGFADYAGIFQRLSIITGWTWITLLSIHFQRTMRVQE